MRAAQLILNAGQTGLNYSKNIP